jgi:outer membrane protein TolC
MDSGGRILINDMKMGVNSMAKSKITLTLVLLVFLSLSTMAQRREVNTTLEECIADAVKYNLNVQVEIYNPAIAEANIKRAKESYFPQLGFRFQKQSQENPTYSYLEGDETVVTEYGSYAGQLYQEIPGGGNLTVLLNSYKNDSNASFQTINPRYGATLSFDFTQPLLRNFMYNPIRRQIVIAGNNLDVSDARFKTALLQTVYAVEEAYWNLVFSIEDLKVRQQSLLLAKDLLRKNRKEVEVGTLAPIEILTAEAEVAAREADILQAEVMVENNEDTLKTIINRYPEQDAALISLRPSDEPQYDETDISLDQALKVALLNRPDLQERRFDFKNREYDLSYAKNQMLPELNLNASYWSPGLSGTQLIYQDDNPATGIIIGQIPGAASDSLRDAFDFTYVNWDLNLTLSLPIDSLLSRAQYTQAKLALDQALVQIAQQEKQIFLDVRNAVRFVQTNYKRVEAYRIARELAQEKLEVEEKKLRVGMTTNYIVLQQQRDLANARSAEVRALIDYNLSLAGLDRAMGITLDKKNIKLAR